MKKLTYVLKFRSTGEVCLRGGVYDSIDDALDGRLLKNLFDICYVFPVVQDVQQVTNPDLILDPTKPAYIVQTFGVTA
jgi:hypothetical protein